VEDLKLEYERRLSADGSWDSICLHCLRTVVASTNEAELDLVEDNHICSEVMIHTVRKRLQPLLADGEIRH
jgi:hypothetical protein